MSCLYDLKDLLAADPTEILAACVGVVELEVLAK